MTINWPKLIILLIIAALVLGTDRLRTLGADLGAAIKGFKKEMGYDNQKTSSINQSTEHNDNQDKL